jgi:DNA polymerase kappa
MPGFHEHDENDAHLTMDPDDEEHLEATDQLEGNSIACTMVAQAISSTEPGPSIQRMNSSSRTHSPARSVILEQPAPSESLEVSQQVCPVCSKTLDTDNQGLNAHIDFCLSRGAIKEAHAEAASPVKNRHNTQPSDPGLAWSGWGKPNRQRS